MNNRAVTSTTSTVATATAAINSATGTYNLANVTLAKTQEIYSALQTSASSTLSGGAGSLTFTLKSGKTETVSLASGSLSLNAIAKAVNATKGGVQASVVNSSTGARLVFQGSCNGQQPGLFGGRHGGAVAQFAYTTASPGTDVLAQAAANASLTLNGVPVTSATNTLVAARSPASPSSSPARATPRSASAPRPPPSPPPSARSPRT